MPKHSWRAKWNTANARLANKPFDDLFTENGSITCPRCGMTSYNLNDIKQRYCGNCHRYHSEIMMEDDMTTFHFKPHLIHLLTWFKDSPDTGHPDCICSYCAEVIEEGAMPLRVFSDENTELRLHMHCARMVIVEFGISPIEKAAHLIPKSEYQYEPGFAEGQAAQAEGERRGANPYSANGPQRACHAWWAGWDDAWEEANAKD